MVTCPNCRVGIPEGMRFCLQCGHSIDPPPAPEVGPVEAEPPIPERSWAPPAPEAAPEPPPPWSIPPPPPRGPTVPLKIAPTPVIAPRSGAYSPPPRPSLGDPMLDLDEEMLRKSFEKPVAPPGVVVCRFCKGPLDLEGDFCEQCGAPVVEAAPPGALRPKPEPVPAPAMPTASAFPPGTDSDPTQWTGPDASAQPASPLPMPDAPDLTSTPPAADERQAGLMGRFKGLFKKS